MYKIDTDSFTKAIADLVTQFKQENPSVGEFKCVCHDGTVVDIKIEARKKKSKKA